MSDELIRQLVLDLQPVARLARPLRRAVQFTLPVAALTAAGTGLAGVRADLLLKLCDPLYWVESALLAALFAAATLAAFTSGVPGARLRPLLWLVACAAGTWLLLVACYSLSTPAILSLASGVACVRRTLLLGVVPASALLIMLKRSRPLEGRTSGALVMISAGALALLATRALCRKDDGLHALIWHGLPLALLALIGAGVGRAWFSGGSTGALRTARKVA